MDVTTTDTDEPVAVDLAVNGHGAEAACEATFEAVRVVELDGSADDL